ncbi:MAG: hypothetical protein F6K47_28875 [Symploca sp. SIO2E6]|nr:hypothetical protein [Symploca sp. SIO2E6]
MSLQAELLEQSFELVKPQAGEFVNSFYDNLFTDYPAAKPLFEHTNMAKQKQMLLGGLVMVVENLRKPEVLSENLQGLGARHVKYGALPAHYPLVGNSLLKTFEQYLGTNWTEEVKQSWVDAYGAITTLMLEGAEYAPQEVALEEPKEDSGLAVELLEQSFEQVKPQAGEFVNSFYDNLFTDYPAAKPLFEHTNMAKQKQMLLGGLVMVVENLRKPEVLSENLQGLGARHVKYGALPEHYPLVGNSLLKTFEQYLGTNWTEEVKQSWVDAYGAITTLMLEGAEYAPQEVALEEPKEDSGLAVELLEQSFEQVKPQAGEFVNSFYDNLFTDYPAAKPLFEHTNMAKQKQMLLGALVMVVENLRKPEVLSESLQGLGARHVKYGALPEHYPLVGNSLLKTFEQYLGTNWTEEVKQAWINAYGAIAALMLEGAEYTPEEVELNSPSGGGNTAAATPAMTMSIEQPEPNWNILFGIGGLGVVGFIVVLLLLLL